MAYLLFLAVRESPSIEDIPALREKLEKSFPNKYNLSYLDALAGSSDRPALPRVTAERLGAISLLPSLLAAACIPTESLVLRRDQRGRPYCETPDGPAGFDFNLSHSAFHVAGALLVGGGKVGVDVEEMIPSERALPLIRRFCTEGELELLADAPPSDDPAADLFTSIWVEREALAKQNGQGMPLRFDTARIPEGLTVWKGYLPTTNTRLALCAPMKNAPRYPRLLPDSLPVVFT